jgi:hypothetical protein
VGVTTCCSGNGGIVGLEDDFYFEKVLSVRSNVSDMGWVFIVGTVVILPLSLHVGGAGLFVEPGRDRC